MPNQRGKRVDFLRVTGSKSGGRLSPDGQYDVATTNTTCGQPAVIHYLSDWFIQTFSAPIFRPLPLAEHYLYPLSTAPTNNPTKRKFKER